MVLLDRQGVEIVVSAEELIIGCTDENTWSYNPNANFEVPHKTNEINKCVMGEKSLTAHSSFPKIEVESPIIQAINGGLVK